MTNFPSSTSGHYFDSGKSNGSDEQVGHRILVGLWKRRGKNRNYSPETKPNRLRLIESLSFWKIDTYTSQRSEWDKRKFQAFFQAFRRLRCTFSRLFTACHNLLQTWYLLRSRSWILMKIVRRSFAISLLFSSSFFRRTSICNEKAFGRAAQSNLISPAAGFLIKSPSFIWCHLDNKNNFEVNWQN